MRKVLTAVIVIAAALYAADPAREQTLQRAIDLMESKGDLAKAMPLFEEAARSADKALAARALLYLGQGQERQGADKARGTYERIIKEFGNQTETVAAARKRLAGLGDALQTPLMSARLVIPADKQKACDIDTITADGRFGAGADWTTGDLIVRDMAMGKVTRLLPGSLDQRSWTGRYVAWAVLSPDQKQIVFARYGDPKQPNQGQLWVMPNVPGANPRLISDNPEYRNLPAQAWSPDGKSVLVTIERVDRSYQLAWVSVADGSVKVLKSFDWIHQPNYRARLSPDGRYIAYSATVGDNFKESYISVLSSDASIETVLVKTAGRNDAPVWTPDGSHILFVSNRSGASDLWSIPVHEGKPAGGASLVKRDIGPVANIGITRSGSLYYDSDQSDIEYISIAGLSGHSASESFVGNMPRWSPDGKYIALMRHRPSISGTADLVVHSLDSGEEKTYSHDGLRGSPPRWFPDGQSILVNTGTGGMEKVFYRVDLKSGEFHKVLSVGALLTAAGNLSPDGKTLYLVGRSDAKTFVFDRAVAYDLTTGRALREFKPDGGISGIALSPDGSTLAIAGLIDQQTREARLSRISVDGADSRELYKSVRAVKKTLLFDKIAWTRDGREILFTESDRNNNFRLLRISAEGGKAEYTGFEATGIISIDLHHDGSRIAYSAAKQVREIWALDNLQSVWEKQR
jgi:Tol biopolymer transport system component